MATSFTTPTSDTISDTAFDTAFDTAPEPETQEASPDTELPPDSDPVTEDATAKPAEGEEPQVGEDEEPEQVEQDGRNAYRMSKGRMERFTNAAKFQEAISDFGISSVQAAQELYEAASDANTMALDFKNPFAQVEGPNGAKVAAIDAFMDHWHGTSPDGMAALATRMLPYLNERMPQVVRHIEGQVMTVQVNRAYSAAQQAESQAPGSEQAKAALFKAQSLDYAINGRHKALADLPKLNPQQGQLSEIQRREQALQQNVQRYEDGQWKSFSAHNIDGAKQAALDSAVDNALKIVKDKFSPKVLGSMRNSILSEAQQALKKNFDWDRNHALEAQDIQREFRQALRTDQRTQIEPRVKAHVADYQARLSRIIPAIAKSYIQDATNQAVAANRQTHERAASASRQVSPSGSGRPAGRSPGGKFTSIEAGLDAVLG
jgi:hypothetical protein